MNTGGREGIWGNEGIVSHLTCTTNSQTPTTTPNTKNQTSIISNLNRKGNELAQFHICAKLITCGIKVCSFFINQKENESVYIFAMRIQCIFILMDKLIGR